MKSNMMSKHLDNKGSGLAVVLYGVTLLLVLIFTAINFVNSKVIEDGYNSLRDAVQAASSGSVIHLIESQERADEQQKNVNEQEGSIENSYYDVYLQLALGYFINRDSGVDKDDDKIVQTGDINNFIKLDHQKVVNSTMSLLKDAVYRDKTRDIKYTGDYKILMFFIEPNYTEGNKKYFNIIAYGNCADSYTGSDNKILEFAQVDTSKCIDMKDAYQKIEDAINGIVNNNKYYKTDNDFDINLNAKGTSDYEGLIRAMETYPHYLIVVKDFALPTIFDNTDTTDDGDGIRRLFDLSGGNTLKTPMCALNTGKVQRQYEKAGWSKKR